MVEVRRLGRWLSSLRNCRGIKSLRHARLRTLSWCKRWALMLSWIMYVTFLLPVGCGFTYYNQVIKFYLARPRLLEQDPRRNFQLPLPYLRHDRHSGHSSNLCQRGCCRGQCTITRIWHPRNRNHSTLRMYTQPRASTPCIRITRSDHQEAFSSVYSVW